MKKILFLIDFLENVSDVFFYVVKLYGSVEVEFIVIYFFENEVLNLMSRIDIGKFEKVLEKFYDDFIKEGICFLEVIK